MAAVAHHQHNGKMAHDGIAPSGPNSDYGAPVDLNETRRAALAEIDSAKLGWYHVRAVLVAGVGFYTDAYDIFAINIASTMIGYVYGAGGGKLTSTQDLGIKVATPVGTLCGQLLFGWLADVVGRKKMYGIELMIIIVGSFAQTLCAQGPALSIIGALVVWRFIMGVGIGGDYPLSAVISSEFAATRIRGRMMTLVFAMQGWGQLSAALVGLVVVTAYGDKIKNLDAVGQPYTVDICWRWLIGLGCVPACAALYFRLTIPETPRFTMDIERNVKQAASDVDAFMATGTYVHDYDQAHVKVEAPKATRRDFIAHFSQWKHFRLLFGAAYSWFALDIAFYGLGLNSSIVLGAIGFGSATTGTPQEIIYTSLRNVCIGNVILSVAGLIPGYYATFLFIDSWGRKPIQIMGFTMLTILFIILGTAYFELKNNSVAAFIVLYCLVNFFQNFGPNTTTFIVPGECFPTRYRSTAHGISAASGKLGAIVAQILAFETKDIGGTNNWINHLLQIFAGIMFTGLLSSFLIIETKGRTLEELSGENQENFVQAHALERPVSRPVAVVNSEKP